MKEMEKPVKGIFPSCPHCGENLFFPVFLKKGKKSNFQIQLAEGVTTTPEKLREKLNDNKISIDTEWRCPHCKKVLNAIFCKSHKRKLKVVVQTSKPMCTLCAGHDPNCPACSPQIEVLEATG